MTKQGTEQDSAAGKGEQDSTKSAEQDSTKSGEQDSKAASQQQQQQQTDGDKEAAKNKAETDRARAEAAKSRTELRDFKKGIAKALGIETGDDPEKELVRVRAENKQLRARGGFDTACTKLDADPALTWAVLLAGGTLDDLDFTNADAVNAAIATALETNPKLKTTDAKKVGSEAGGGGGKKGFDMNRAIRAASGRRIVT